MKCEPILPIVCMVVMFFLGFGSGWVTHGESEDVWDRAAAISDEFRGWEIVLGHEGTTEWKQGTLAELDALVENFIDYRATRYGENWWVRGGSCGNRIVERIA